MDRQKELHFITQNPRQYLETQGKSLDKRLEQIDVSVEKKQEIKKQIAQKTIREKGLSFLGGLGEVINTVITWNEQINEDLTEAKKAILLEQYFKKSDDHENSIKYLKAFLVNPQGNTIYNKILRLLDNSPPNPELTEHLSNVLMNIIKNGNFEDLFERHSYALSQIERLTPQALTIIHDYKEWPSIKLGSVMTQNAKINSDFHEEFTRAYCQLRNVKDPNKYQRVQHSVIELQRQGFMEAYKRENGQIKCHLTVVGLDMLVYLE